MTINKKWFSCAYTLKSSPNTLQLKTFRVLKTQLEGQNILNELYPVHLILEDTNPIIKLFKDRLEKQHNAEIIFKEIVCYEDEDEN